MIPLSYFFVVGALLFGIGLLGILLNRNNLITLFMCLELMLLAASMNFIAFARYSGLVDGEIMVFFILSIAAAESAIGLSILVLWYRWRGNIKITQMNMLKD